MQFTAYLTFRDEINIITAPGATVRQRGQFAAAVRDGRVNLPHGRDRSAAVVVDFDPETGAVLPPAPILPDQYGAEEIARDQNVVAVHGIHQQEYEMLIREGRHQEAARWRRGAQGCFAAAETARRRLETIGADVPRFW